MRIERRETRPAWLVIGAPVSAVLVALMAAGLLVGLSGAPVFEAFGRMAVGAFGSKLAITETLTRAVPLILTGLAAAVAFRAQVWNIGAEGQLYAGALAVAALGAANPFGAPAYLLIPMLLVAGAVAGMILLIVPVALRLRFGVDEVVTTLLMNFIVLLFVSLAIEGFLRDPLAFGWPQSVPVPPEARLEKLVTQSRLHTGLIVAVGAALVVFAINRFTVFGLQSRAAGLQADAARFAGAPISLTLLKVACLSGGLAGLAGAVEVLGVKGHVSTALSPGFGYTGIVVAMLAALSPIGVIFAGLFVAAMFVGADGMSRAMGVPSFIADVTVSLALLTMLIALFLTQFRIRR
ncbi:ABC transporter permease [Pseudoruegeria sp. SK021]|uniref:ABC transporter permease n=1 Tax=Pseudoruegeria sp. SK021 TaxID=1933035 RepID=UPI000A251F8D|nr:ABC transporter permease [Pseudoruegeria sp. SK021]OSP55997.1 ABC transporter permease [Pseudoruegeria sp. SK021]